VRYLETAGIPTVIMGAAKDIVEYYGAPRWKLGYSNLEQLTAEEISRLRDEAEKARITARDIRVKSVGI
jgi:hypothetical protein